MSLEKIWSLFHIVFIVIFATTFFKMNRPLKKRDKRIALLLTAAFAWLFIGSLVIFHEEHVLRKHFNTDFQVFITPKSKDKQGFTGKFLQPVQKYNDYGTSAGILGFNGYPPVNYLALDLIPKDPSSFIPDDLILSNFPLRAPPTV